MTTNAELKIHVEKLEEKMDSMIDSFIRLTENNEWNRYRIKDTLKELRG